MEKEKKVSKNFENKKKIVSEIEKFAKDSKSVIFMDYRGINVAEDTILRKKFRENGVTYKIYKNNLVRIALNNMGITDLNDKLKGTLSVAFSTQDEITAAKIITGEKFKNKMSFQFGLIGNSVLDAAEVTRLASMPNKETLIAQIMGLIQSGARNLATVIQAVPRNLTCVLDARAKQL